MYAFYILTDQCECQRERYANDKVNICSESVFFFVFVSCDSNVIKSIDNQMNRDVKNFNAIFSLFSDVFVNRDTLERIASHGMFRVLPPPVRMVDHVANLTNIRTSVNVHQVSVNPFLFSFSFRVLTYVYSFNLSPLSF